MSQSDLAGKLFVTPQAVSRWERGETEPDVDTIKRLAEVFNVSVEEVINGPTQGLKKEDQKRIHLIYMIGSILMVIVSIACSIVALVGLDNVLPLFIALVAVSFIFLLYILGAEIYIFRMNHPRQRKNPDGAKE